MNRDHRPFPLYEIRTKVNEVSYRAIRLQSAGSTRLTAKFHVTMLEFQTRRNALYIQAQFDNFLS